MTTGNTDHQSSRFIRMLAQACLWIFFYSYAVDGAAAHGAAIELAQHTEPKIRAVLEPVVGKPAGP
jgi:hypothetical protein